MLIINYIIVYIIMVLHVLENSITKEK